jgi:hypothetical protein
MPTPLLSRDCDLKRVVSNSQITRRDSRGSLPEGPIEYEVAVRYCSQIKEQGNTARADAVLNWLPYMSSRDFGQSYPWKSLTEISIQPMICSKRARRMTTNTRIRWL